MEDKERQLSEATSALATERRNSTGGSSEVSSAKYAELVQKVETMSALTDSNRLLREETQKLDKLLTDTR